MFALAEDLHAVVGKVLKKSVERKARAVNVDIAQFAVEIGVFVDQLQTQPVSVF
jgi:hypothetical protein